MLPCVSWRDFAGILGCSGLSGFSNEVMTVAFIGTFEKPEQPETLEKPK